MMALAPASSRWRSRTRGMASRSAEITTKPARLSGMLLSRRTVDEPGPRRPGRVPAAIDREWHSCHRSESGSRLGPPAPTFHWMAERRGQISMQARTTPLALLAAVSDGRWGRRAASRSFALGTAAARSEQVGHLGLFRLKRDCQRRHVGLANLGNCIDVGAAIQQEPREVDMAFRGCEMEYGLAKRARVNVGAFVDQELCDVGLLVAVSSIGE